MFNGVLRFIHGVYTGITGVHRCNYGHEGIYRVHTGYTMMGSHVHVLLHVQLVGVVVQRLGAGKVLQVEYL